MSVADFVVASRAAAAALYPSRDEHQDLSGLSHPYLLQSSSGLGDTIMIGHPEQVEQHYTLPNPTEYTNGAFYAGPGAIDFSSALDGSPSSSPTDSPSVSIAALPPLSGLDTTYDHAMAPGAGLSSSQQQHNHHHLQTQSHQGVSISNNMSANLGPSNGDTNNNNNNNNNSNNSNNNTGTGSPPTTSPSTPPLPSYRTLPPMSPRTILNTLDEINASQPKKKSHARKQPAGHIPRPRNAFILFRCLFVCQQAVPASVEKDHRNISRIAGRVWKAMSESERDPWVKAAEIEKSRHEEKWPGYRYNPVQPITNPAQLRRNFTATVAGGSRNATTGFGGTPTLTPTMNTIGLSLPERGRTLTRGPALSGIVPPELHFPGPQEADYGNGAGGFHAPGAFSMPLHAPQAVQSHNGLLMHAPMTRVGSAPPDNMSMSMSNSNNNDLDRQMMPPPALPTLPAVQFTHPFLQQPQQQSSTTPTPTSASVYSSYDYDASPQLPPDSPPLFFNNPAFFSAQSHNNHNNNGMMAFSGHNDFFPRPPARRSSSCPPLPPGAAGAGSASSGGHGNGAGAGGGGFGAFGAFGTGTSSPFGSGLLDAWPAPSAYGLSSASQNQSHGHGQSYGLHHGHGHGMAMDVMSDDAVVGMFRNPFSSGTTVNANANGNAAGAGAGATNGFTGLAASPFNGVPSSVTPPPPTTAATPPATVGGTEKSEASSEALTPAVNQQQNNNNNNQNQNQPSNNQQNAHPQQNTHSSLLFQTPRYQHMHHGFDTHYVPSHHHHHAHSHNMSPPASTRLVHRRGSSLDRAIASSSIAGAFGAFSGFAGQWSRASQQWSRDLWAPSTGNGNTSGGGGATGQQQHQQQQQQQLAQRSVENGSGMMMMNGRGGGGEDTSSQVSGQQTFYPTAYTLHTPILSPSSTSSSNTTTISSSTTCTPTPTTPTPFSRNLLPATTRKFSARLFGSQGARLGLDLALDAPMFFDDDEDEDATGTVRSQLSAVSRSTSSSNDDDDEYDEDSPVTPAFRTARDSTAAAAALGNNKKKPDTARLDVDVLGATAGDASDRNEGLSQQTKGPSNQL